MTLKALELSSFKSFGKKSAISFTTPITAIVGPNGSGKSNIVESIRFVLGEQSMKSLRGKGGVDLIFKGSKNMSSANRAQVSITFDNSKKIFSFTNSGLGVSLEYDEITISREVFADGVNKYSINGTEVRLKDVVDLLASVNIGSSGHHIISQGEADRVLNSSSKDRKSMLEDALGLKVYQYRIRESERKLEKTLLNIKEVQSLRREIAPHLAFLKKQVAVVEKARLMREELRDLYKSYLPVEAVYVNKESDRLTHMRRILDEKALALDEKIASLQKEKSNGRTESVYADDIKKYEAEIRNLQEQKDGLARSLGRIEGIMEGIERNFARMTHTEEKSVSESELKEFIKDIEHRIDEAIQEDGLDNIIRILKNIKSKFGEFLNKSDKQDKKAGNPMEDQEYLELVREKEKINSDLENIKNHEDEVNNLLTNMKKREQEENTANLESERVLYDLQRSRNEVGSEMHSLRFEEEKLVVIKNAFESEMLQAGALIGQEAVSFARAEITESVSRENQEELRRKIERIKIKLEDSGSGNGAEIMQEYQDTEDRDRFLVKELDDLHNSIESLRSLINELKHKMDDEFKDGLSSINKQFQEFFALMFGGGQASLTMVMDNKRPKSKEESDWMEESADPEAGMSLEFEKGVEINVSLPKKKVKDLHMLSGGERSLTSIALLFAISQVNPPPFLVLDETDAALDEANSRKYGNMLENLSKYSQLIVVTHNRETMSRAQVLYGVTMGAEGASKLLSIHLEDASVYAK